GVARNESGGLRVERDDLRVLTDGGSGETAADVIPLLPVGGDADEFGELGSRLLCGCNEEERGKKRDGNRSSGSREDWTSDVKHGVAPFLEMLSPSAAGVERDRKRSDRSESTKPHRGRMRCVWMSSSA